MLHAFDVMRDTLASNPIVQWVLGVLFTYYLPQDPYWRYWPSFFVSGVCASIAIRFARTKEIQANPRLYTILAMFAIAVLAKATSTFGAQGLDDDANVKRLLILVDRVDDISAAIWVFAGAILVRDVGQERWAHTLQVWTIGLLTLAILALQFYQPWEWVYLRHAYYVLSTALACLAYWALMNGAQGVLAVASLDVNGKPPRPLRWLVFWLIVCVALEIVFNVVRTCEILWRGRKLQSDFFVLFFSFARLAITILFCRIVYWHAKWPSTPTTAASSCRLAPPPKTADVVAAQPT